MEPTYHHLCGGPAFPKVPGLFTVIFDDPDAPTKTWIHWVVFNIPADSTGLPEDVASDQLPAGAVLGRNNFTDVGYSGLCPPDGTHGYHLKFYALDTMLD